ncbi:hypothetical protein PO909_006789 [Leuciscus waleckii]
MRASLAVCDPVKPCTPQPPLVRQYGSWVQFEDPVILLLTHPWPSRGDRRWSFFISGYGLDPTDCGKPRYKQRD